MLDGLAMAREIDQHFDRHWEERRGDGEKKDIVSEPRSPALTTRRWVAACHQFVVTLPLVIRWLTLIIQAGLSSLTLGLIVFQSAITYSKPLKNQDGTARRTVPALSLRSACTLSVQTIRPLNINQLSVHRMCPYDPCTVAVLPCQLSCQRQRLHYTIFF